MTLSKLGIKDLVILYFERNDHVNDGKWNTIIGTIFRTILDAWEILAPQFFTFHLKGFITTLSSMMEHETLCVYPDYRHYLTLFVAYARMLKKRRELSLARLLYASQEWTATSGSRTLKRKKGDDEQIETFHKPKLFMDEYPPQPEQW